MLLAAICIVSPVLGLRPVLAALCLTLNVPKPTTETWSPSLNADVTLATTASTARPASALDRFAALATASINLALFIPIPYALSRLVNYPKTPNGVSQSYFSLSSGSGLRLADCACGDVKRADLIPRRILTCQPAGEHRASEANGPRSDRPPAVWIPAPRRSARPPADVADAAARDRTPRRST